MHKPTEAGNRGIVNHRTTTRGDDRRDLVFHRCQNAPNINIHNMGKVFATLFGGGDHHIALNPSVVKGYVEAAVGGHGLFHQLLDLRLVAGVGLNKCSGTAGASDGINHPLAFLGATPADHHFCTRSGIGLGGGFANARGGAGDQSNESSESRE